MFFIFRVREVFEPGWCDNIESCLKVNLTLRHNHFKFNYKIEITTRDQSVVVTDDRHR